MASRRPPRMAQPMPDAKPEAPRPEPKMVEPERVPSMTKSQFDLTAEHRARMLESDESAAETTMEPEPVEMPLVEAPSVPAAPPVPPAPPERPPEPPPEPPPAAPVAQPATATVPQPQSEHQTEPASSGPSYPRTMKQTIVVVDNGWRQFLAAASAFPSERMDERLQEDGWTRKQMLAHISAWHDQTHDRLGPFILSGEPQQSVGDIDAFNARVARQAIGRTAGEVLKEMEMTFNRLRRRLVGLTDQQLMAHDAWAAQVVAANTYEHYLEHSADVYQPPLPEKTGRR